MFARAFAAATVFLFTAASCFGQQPPAAPAPPPNVASNPPSGSNLTGFFSTRTPYEFWLTCVIGLFGLVIVGVLVWSVGRTQNHRPEDATRPIIIVTVIIGTLILVTAGYSNEQIAPAFGLFGTIIGYILGRLTQPPATEPASTTVNVETTPSPAPKPQGVIP